MISSKQLFSNYILPKDFAKDVIKTGHDITNIQIDHAFPVFCILVILALILLVVFIQYIIENYIFKSGQEEELLGIEGLVNFY